MTSVWLEIDQNEEIESRRREINFFWEAGERKFGQKIQKLRRELS